jgi:hypothetical protein
MTIASWSRALATRVLDLLRGSTPDSWMGLRRDYSELRQVLERDDQERQQEQERQATDEQKEQKDRQRRELAERLRERRNVWAGMRRERRESLLFQVLGDERLILRELTSRMNAELGTPDHESNSTVYQGDVRTLVMRMFHAGQLERVAESFKNKTRYRYFRKRGLNGPIVDLERAYHDDERGGES